MSCLLTIMEAEMKKWTLLLFLLSAPAFGQEKEESHHKFYQNWMRPDMPSASCCGRWDCYPTEFKQVNGRWFALRREDGAWMPIPPEKMELNRDSPDGRNHVCMQAPGKSDTIFCAITGGGS